MGVVRMGVSVGWCFFLLSRRPRRSTRFPYVTLFQAEVLACNALAGAGVGMGTIFGGDLEGAVGNPTAARAEFPNLLLGFALAEATGLFGLVVALILLFVICAETQLRSSRTGAARPSPERAGPQDVPPAPAPMMRHGAYRETPLREFERHAAISL